ncbi:hypothetical protein KIW84_024782 [Lathyrus oleraceus]|uniref:Uncharacterized protein n=1 Tax=Pisum sativum TaxID=3888 RepID=A0A9D4YHN4_PEA|nr:hypothetical protein KIW84_024782 [Pisum sativum]
MKMAHKDKTENLYHTCRSSYGKERIMAMAANCRRLAIEMNSQHRMELRKIKICFSIRSTFGGMARANFSMEGDHPFPLPQGFNAFFVSPRALMALHRLPPCDRWDSVSHASSCGIGRGLPDRSSHLGQFGKWVFTDPGPYGLGPSA